MPFVVYEDDPVVRDDICETLMEEFQDAGIAVAETLDCLTKLTANLSERIVAIVSLSSHEIERMVSALSKLKRDVRVVAIVSTMPEKLEDDPNWVFVQRPFGSSALVNSVSRVLSDPPQDRT